MFAEKLDAAMLINYRYSGKGVRVAMVRRNAKISSSCFLIVRKVRMKKAIEAYYLLGIQGLFLPSKSLDRVEHAKGTFYEEVLA